MGSPFSTPLIVPFSSSTDNGIGLGEEIIGELDGCATDIRRMVDAGVGDTSDDDRENVLDTNEVLGNGSDRIGVELATDDETTAGTTVKWK